MNWLENMVLRSKLIVLILVMISGLLVVGVIGFNGISQWSKDMTTFGEKRIPIMIALSDLNRERMSIRAQTLEAWKYQNDPSATDGFQKIIDARKKSWETVDKNWKVIDAFKPSSEKGKALKDELVPAYKEWRDIYIQLDVLLAKFATPHDAAMHSALFAEYKETVSTMVPLSNTMGKLMDDMGENNKNNTVTMINNAESQSSSMNFTMLITMGTILVLGILLAILIIRSITRSITSSVTSIRDGAMQITSASDQVASSSSSLAQGASEQASSVEEVSAPLEESNILAKNANDSAKAGYEKGEQLSHSMHAITESAAKISGIIKTIDQIAFQTNLLALNAAVEAARAGEHGLGFAVVADEVRNLAQRAASAAKETSDIIEEVVGQIKEGNQIALATHTSFQEIVEQSKKVSDLIGEIAIAGKEQAEGMSQINQAMGQVDQVTQQVAANSEEAAAAAEELNAQATSMMETVRILAKMVGMENDTPVQNVRKVNLHHLDPKPVITSRPPTQTQRKVISSVAKAENVFPLSEDDLKEF